MIVEAEIHLLSTAEGGRSNPIAATRYRPNHKFEGFDDYTIGQVDLIAVASLEPGQSASAKVTFIRRPDSPISCVLGPSGRSTKDCAGSDGRG
jgi:translation elongation factor EF-Tu-like GTPase